MEIIPLLSKFLGFIIIISDTISINTVIILNYMICNPNNKQSNSEMTNYLELNKSY